MKVKETLITTINNKEVELYRIYRGDENPSNQYYIYGWKTLTIPQMGSSFVSSEKPEWEDITKLITSLI